MANVKFIAVSRGLRGIVDYVTNREKTAEQLISGVNCVARTAVPEFEAVKKQFRKTEGRGYYHIVQAFAPDDPLDFTTAHELGVKLAEHFEGYQCIVVTHMNTAHIHNHIIMNSVNFETGMKFHQSAREMQQVKDYCSQLCWEYGLSVTESKADPFRIPTWKRRLTDHIKEAMEQSRTQQEFVAYMNAYGYDVKWEPHQKYITYTTPDGLKCRDSKLHEEKYCKEAMEHEFRIRAEIVSARTQAAQHQAGSTSDADTTSRSVSLENRLGANDEIHGCTVVPCGSADRSVGEHQQTDVAASLTDAAGRSAEGSAASGADDRTGWEAERKFFFSAQNQTSKTASTTRQYSGIDLSADGGGSTASALVGLGHRLEQLQPAAPVTPVHYHTDSKMLQKEREKKIALGHKADDHEDEVSYDWQQTM